MDNSKLLFTTRKDLFIDDKSVPYETRVYHSISKTIIWFIVSAIMLITLTWLALNDNKSYFAVILMGTIFSFVFINSIRQLVGRKPQVIINTNGLQAGKLPFYNWGDIKNETIITKIRRGPTYFLKYDSPSGTKEFHMNLWDIDHQQFEKLLIIYRGRNNHGIINFQ